MKRIWFTLCILAGGTMATNLTAGGPPEAPVQLVVDDHWGVKVSDPYRYMEDLDNPDVQAWFKAQGAYAESVLTRLPARRELLDRIIELEAGQPYKIWGEQVMADGSLFYTRQEIEENVGKLCYRKSFDGPEQILIDPNLQTTPTGGHFSIYFYQPSPDGTKLCYGLAASGSEDVVLHVYDLAAGGDVDVEISRLEPYYMKPQWLPDGSGFIYNRLRELPPEAPATDGYKRSQTFLHRLGTAVEDDPVMLEMDQYPGVDMADVDFPAIAVPFGSDHVIGQIKHGDANQLTLHTAELTALLEGEPNWRAVCDVPDSVIDFAVQGNSLYLLSSLQAPRFKVLRVDLDSPDLKQELFVPESEYVLRGVSVSADALYISALHDGDAKVIRIAGDTQQVLTPPDGAPSTYLSYVSAGKKDILVSTASWIKRGSTFLYDPSTDTYTDYELSPRGKYDDPEDLAYTKVEVASHDGVLVPLTIVHKKGIVRDGSNPTLLSGYGAYGISRSPSFSPTSLAWLERGGILATAHVRGGGEKGMDWHLAGQKQTKPNTWKDFIACAEYLVAEGYTSPGHLAGQGGSAGGILIGRAITARPDLFGAAIIAVGDCDMIRVETTTNGVPNIQEFGTVAVESEFHALLEMSAYHHVKDGVAYPAVLLTHGMNDPRVDPWLSGKMCARLQAATASEKPVLLRVDYHAGHGIGSTKRQYQEQYADVLAFLLSEVGAS